MDKNLISEILELSLYVPIKLTEEQVKKYNKIDSDKLRSYCHFCKEISVFNVSKRCYYKGRETTQYIAATPEYTPRIPTSISRRNQIFNRQPLKCEDISNVLILSCGLDRSHQITIFLQVIDNSIIKVGQYPSFSDLQIDNKALYKELPEKDAREMNRATGLFSHGIGVGSFVYLRRIFENLITQTYDDMSSPDVDRATFLSFRMSERIDYLKEYLPPIIVEQRKVFSILSKGIHEMEEEECLTYFPTIKESIELMLQEHLNKKMTARRASELTKEINEVHQSLKEE